WATAWRRGAGAFGLGAPLVRSANVPGSRQRRPRPGRLGRRVDRGRPAARNGPRQHGLRAPATRRRPRRPTRPPRAAGRTWRAHRRKPRSGGARGAAGLRIPVRVPAAEVRGCDRLAGPTDRRRAVTLAEALARFAATTTFEQLPAEVVGSVELRVLDTLGICLASTSFGLADGVT